MITPATPAPAGPRFLYLHGFASGPASKKGLAFAAHFAALGVNIERLDLRLPSLERLRLSAGMAAARAAIGGERDRAVLIGSSMGALTAARVAAADARVCALVLMAPAFDMSRRWRERMGDEGFARWRQSGWLEIDDYATRQRARVDFGFHEDLVTLDEADGGWPDVRVPTLIIHGRQDQTVDIEGSRTFAAGKGHVTLVELDDGHELVSSLPRTLALVEVFLSPCLGRLPGPA
jgi:pimeloyl-ACP methyl ester carboxylesterase